MNSILLLYVRRYNKSLQTGVTLTHCKHTFLFLLEQKAYSNFCQTALSNSHYLVLEARVVFYIVTEGFSDIL